MCIRDRGENQPEDHVRYARNDLMGMVREDLGYDMARHVDLSLIHISEPTRLLSISYAVFCLKKKNNHIPVVISFDR